MGRAVNGIRLRPLFRVDFTRVYRLADSLSLGALRLFRIITWCVRTFNLAYHLVGVRKCLVMFVALCGLFIPSVSAILGIERHRVFVQGYACLFYINPYMRVYVRSCKTISLYSIQDGSGSFFQNM